MVFLTVFKIIEQWKKLILGTNKMLYTCLFNYLNYVVLLLMQGVDEFEQQIQKSLFWNNKARGKKARDEYFFSF